MKYIVKEGNCTIVLDSKRSDEKLELALRGLACTITAVDLSSQWTLFIELMTEVNQICLSMMEREGS